MIFVLTEAQKSNHFQATLQKVWKYELPWNALAFSHTHVDPKITHIFSTFTGLGIPECSSPVKRIRGGMQLKVHSVHNRTQESLQKNLITLTFPCWSLNLVAIFVVLMRRLVFKKTSRKWKLSPYFRKLFLHVSQGCLRIPLQRLK